MKNLKYFVMCNLSVTAILLISSKGFSVTYCVPGTSGGYSHIQLDLLWMGN